MARARDEMRAARTAVLLRCQTAREASRRLDAARAARERDAASAYLQSRRAALADGVTHAQREIAGIGHALQAGLLDQRSFDALVARDEAALASVRLLERDVETAAAGVATAERRLVHANAALLAERRATCKRQRLAEATATTWRRAQDAAEDAEREDQVTDTWRPA